MLCGPGKSSKNCAATATLSPFCVNEITPRTVVPFLGVTLATPIASLTSLDGTSPHAATTLSAMAVASARIELKWHSFRGSLRLVDDPAGHARAGIACRLRLVVVGVLVHDDRLAEDVRHAAADG